jgi:5-methylcytosine-specific restriction endonuclease McrA
MAESQTKKLFKLSLSVRQWLDESQAIVREIDRKHDPRQKFERWRGSKDGKQWKKEQYIKQNGFCALCPHPIALHGSHIDHIQPISLSPDLAVEVTNLRLLCPPCNSSKGNKI